MQEYADKQAIINEVKKTAAQFIAEFDGLKEVDRDIRLDGVDRTPAEMIAYQLGWMALIRRWDVDELGGKVVVTPTSGLKWNQLGELYQSFYDAYADVTLADLVEKFNVSTGEFIAWFDEFTEENVFQPGGRRWASSTPSNWPIWKWVHINTVAPFKSFRGKIRKWKRLKAEI
jgi:hypothetical protein